MIKDKIFGSFIFLIVLASLITGVFSLYISNRYYENSMALNLRHNIYILAEELKEEDFVNFESRIKKFSNIAENRVTLIDKRGKVWRDSEIDVITMQNHGDRPEVQEALKGKESIVVRYSHSVGYDLMYKAIPIETKDFSGVLRLAVPLNKLGSIKKEIASLSLLSIVVGILIAILIAIKIANAIFQPISELTEVAKEISRGNLQKRSFIQSRDEIGMLAQTFNFMSMKIENQVNKLKDRKLKLEAILNSMTDGIIAVDKYCNIMIINPVSISLFDIEKENVLKRPLLEVVRNQQIYDILESSVQNKSYITKEVILQSTKEKILRINVSPILSNIANSEILGSLMVIEDITNIRKLENMRTDFISNVTHELRTPLTSIRGFIDTLRNGAMEDEKSADHFLEIIDIESQRLQRLIEDILSLSEIEMKKETIDDFIQDLSIKDVLEEVRKVLSYKMNAKNIELQMEFENNMTLITMNKDRLKQILINLLDNGIKYTGENGKVYFKCWEQKNNLVMQIKDNGIGIPKEELTRIFERFYRVDKGRARKTGGTGLGLSIVKHIVKLYNGKIEVESEVGKGTVFTIYLPVIKKRKELT